MRPVGTKLLESFDAEVHERLRVNLDESHHYVGKAQQLLWELSKSLLAPHADFRSDRHAFVLHSVPKGCERVPTGRYELGRPVDDEDAARYRLGHPLAQWVLAQAKATGTPHGTLTFDYSGWGASSVALRSLPGQSGWLALSLLSVSGVDAEDHLLWAGATSDGEEVTGDQLRRLMHLPAGFEAGTGAAVLTTAEAAIAERRGALLRQREERQAGWFDAELDKLDKWADDKRTGLKADLRDIDAELKGLKRAVRQSSNLPEKLQLQREVTQLEKRRDELWRTYDASAREIEETKEKLIVDVERRLGQSVEEQLLFTVGWTVV